MLELAQFFATEARSSNHRTQSSATDPQRLVAGGRGEAARARTKEPQKREAVTFLCFSFLWLLVLAAGRFAAGRRHCGGGVI
jgi:hypothetical protein